MEEDFGAAESDVSFGRYRKGSTGTVNFVAMAEQTPGWANSYPKVGPVVMSEIMYNPISGNQYLEYVELFNVTDSQVTLEVYDGVMGANVPWAFTDGIDYEFPPGAVIGALDYLVVAKDPNIFTVAYPAVPWNKILGPYDGQLRNGGERLELGKPGDYDAGSGEDYYIRLDRVNYDDEGLCPTEPDGGNGNGSSLTRINAEDYGNDPNNWGAAVPSPGQ